MSCWCGLPRRRKVDFSLSLLRHSMFSVFATEVRSFVQSYNLSEVMATASQPVCFGMADLAVLHGELLPIRAKYLLFGIKIGLRRREISNIEAKNRSNRANCLREVLVLRLSKSPGLTMRDVDTALRSRTINEPVLADRLQRMYDGHDERLRRLYKVLHPIRVKYFNFGLQIGLSTLELDNIEVNYKFSQQCLRKVLSVRLQRSPALTWRDIVIALRSPAVDEPSLADEIARLYNVKSEHVSMEIENEDLGTKSLTTELDESDLRTLFIRLFEIRGKYNFFGLQIGVTLMDIRMIEANNIDYNDRLLEVLKVRLQQSPAFTWKDIVTALRSPAVNEPMVADYIARLYNEHVSMEVKHEDLVTKSFTAKLDESDLFTLYSNLFEIRVKYKFIGLLIGVTLKDIRNIEAGNIDYDDRLLELLKVRLKQSPALTWRDIIKALRSQVVYEPRLAVEIEREYVQTQLSEEDMRLFKEAMLKGFIESALALILLLGVTGSGKTEFKRIALGQKVPKYSPSTPLAKAAIRSMSVCQVAVDDIEWLEISHQRMLEMVASAIKEGLSFLERTWQHSSQLAFTTSQSSTNKAAQKQEESPVPTTDIQDKATEDIPVTLTEIPAQPYPSEVKPKEESTSTILNPTFLKALEGMKLDFDLLQAMNKPSTESAEKLMDVDFIYLLDSGGQPPFREMLPHFVQQASAIVLMQKLNERLDYRPTIRYREEGGREDKGYTSQLTNEQILYQYIQGVQSHKSKVFVVGTHRDKEGECKGETRREKNQKMIDSFRPVLGNQMELYKVGNPDQLMFPLNCTSRKSHDKRIAKKFRKRVMEKCMGEKVKIPVQWFILEQMLKLLARSMKESILSIDECCEAAQQKLLMPRNVCEAALRYLGRLNIIFFHPDILPNVVFSSAQVILNKLTELVRCNHALRTEDLPEVAPEFTDETLKSKSSVEKSESEESEEASESEDIEESYETNTKSVAIPSYIHGNGGQRFREYGLLDSELLEKAFPSHFRKDLFSSPEFLRLLEKLLIAGRLNNGEHFIPSLLPDLPVEKIGVYRATSEHPPPLVIHYPKMWLPVGVMSSLIVYLQNECKWEPFQIHNSKTCMYHNCYQFHLPSRSPGDMVLIDSIKFLELHVRPKFSLEWEERSDLFRLLSSHVMTGLFKAHESLHYTPPEVELGFLCSGKCCNSEAHFATPVGKRKFWSCSQNPDESGKLTEKQVQWLECAPRCCSPEVTGPKSKSSQSLNMKDIENIKTELKPVKRRWKHIGLALKLDLGQLKKIEKQYGDLDDCLIEMLSLWLNRNYNTKRYGEPSAELLAEAVGDPDGGKDTSLAGNVIKKYTIEETDLDPSSGQKVTEDSASPLNLPSSASASDSENTHKNPESVSQSLQPSQSPTEIQVRKPTQPLISPLDSEDLFDVNSELKPVEARWKHIGRALRLDTDTLNVIERDCMGCSDCLTEVLTLWLKKNYSYQRFGEPSWELLVNAVKHPLGGNDTALAEKIKARHCVMSQSSH